jgi:hypothetical protein
VVAGGAVATVNTNLFSALGAKPFCVFGFEEFADAFVFNFREVFEHAHAVFEAVAFVEGAEAFAGELFALGAAKFTAGFGAVPDAAACNGNASDAIGAAASAASVFIALEGVAEGAVHSAGGNEGFRAQAWR